MEKPRIIQSAQFDPRIKKYLFTYFTIILAIFVFTWPLLIIWVVGVGQMISKKYYENLKCELSEKNLQFSKGALFKIEKTIPLENIQDLTFIQNPILNMFGLQILNIETASSGAANKADMRLIGIIESANFKDLVLRQRENLLEGRTQKGEEESVLEVLKDIRTLLDKK